ncbi:MAG: DUF4153 domain-containing protein [Sphingobium sp.]|nr:DUF4153 domain-containing protein [Sphingobium sp.]
MVTNLTVDSAPSSPNPHQLLDYHQDDWPARRWILALLGAICGVIIYFLAKKHDDYGWVEDTLRLSLATYVGIGAAAFAFVLERGKIRGSIVFALLSGLIVASVLYFSGNIKSWEPWRLLSAALTIIIAAPLFQGWRDGQTGTASTQTDNAADTAGRTLFGRYYFPYRATHDRAWTNICLWGAAWLFVGISFMLAWLLATLFDLIGIDWLKRALNQEYFTLPLIGAAFGGAVGILRDRERTLALLQKIVMMVLSVLAPVLAVGLALFLLALPFTGLHALWDTTKSTTPILLSCIIGALILANAVIGDSHEDEARMPILRWSAMVLGAVMLPLAAIAAYSTSLRIGQYGFTPTRLWAATFTFIACAYGVAYCVALVRARGTGWSSHVRPLNLRLAIGLCALAFLLSTPVISFGGIAAKDQVNRLLSGKVKAEQFDWVAMRFDYGPAGVEALKRLVRSDAPAPIRKTAEEYLKREERYAATQEQEKQEVAGNLVVRPTGTALPAALKERLTGTDACRNMRPCNVIYDAKAQEAIIFQVYGPTVLRLVEGRWNIIPKQPQQTMAEGIDKLNSSFQKGEVEIRSVTRRQIFIDGKAAGEVFE